MFTLLPISRPAVAHILTHSVNLAFGPKSGFKANCRARVGFGRQNEARLQLSNTNVASSSAYNTHFPNLLSSQRIRSAIYDNHNWQATEFWSVLSPVWMKRP